MNFRLSVIHMYLVLFICVAVYVLCVERVDYTVGVTGCYWLPVPQLSSCHVSS